MYHFYLRYIHPWCIDFPSKQIVSNAEQPGLITQNERMENQPPREPFGLFSDNTKRGRRVELLFYFCNKIVKCVVSWLSVTLKQKYFILWT